MMIARRLIVFRHDDYLGNAPAARLFERVKVARTDDPGQPLIGYDQYSITVDQAGIPKTVEVIERWSHSSGISNARLPPRLLHSLRGAQSC
jgi:CRISPR-associated protein Csd2